jgi:hypothetical protein
MKIHGKIREKGYLEIRGKGSNTHLPIHQNKIHKNPQNPIKLFIEKNGTRLSFQTTKEEDNPFQFSSTFS